MLNKNGYVMIYAIGVIALLMLLTATLSNLTMYRSNYTNKQVYNIKEASLARTQVEAAASELSNYFNEYINVDNKYLYELNAEFDLYFTEVELQYGVIIRDLTVETCQYPDVTEEDPCYPVPPETPDSDKHTYTYAYDVVYVGKTLVAQKRFFLSMIPSFLYFSLGSKTDFTLNGGAYIDGNMYVNRNLYLSDTANYKINNVVYNQPTSFSTVSPSTNLYYHTEVHNMYSCRQTVAPCYDLTDNNFKKNINNFLTMETAFEYSTTFVETPPKVMTYNDRFLDVNFDASFIYYIKDSIGDQTREVDLLNISTELDGYRSEGLLYPATTVERINYQDTLSVLVENDLSITTKDLTTDPETGIYMLNFNKAKWVIVDGDLEISNYDNVNKLYINVNFLVTGNITIAGNVLMNSTTYALGEGTMHNANINNVDNLPYDNQLVLLTKESIQFSRINEFDNSFSGIEIDPYTTTVKDIHPNIRGFFFTDSYMQIYTVNSYLVIEGGVFSNDSDNFDINGNIVENQYIVQKDSTTDVVTSTTDSIGLLINSYRGDVNPIPLSSQFNFTYSDYYKKARFVITHSSDVIKTQPKGLPLNKQLNYLFEDVTIKRLG